MAKELLAMAPVLPAPKKTPAKKTKPVVVKPKKTTVQMPKPKKATPTPKKPASKENQALVENIINVQHVVGVVTSNLSGRSIKKPARYN